MLLVACSDAAPADRDTSARSAGTAAITTIPTETTAPRETSTETNAPDASAVGPAPATEADVVRAAEAAEAAAGGEAIRSGVDLLAYVVELRQDDGSITVVQLDIGFGVVFVEDAADGEEGRVDELSDEVDLRRAVEAAEDLAADEAIGAARDGVVVGVELEPGEYDVDIQYPDGRVLEVRLDDTTFALTGTRVRDA